MRWIWSVVIGVVILCSSVRAHAGPLPDGLTLPPTFSVDPKASHELDYFHVEVTYGGKHEDHAGKTWVVRGAVTPKNKSGDETVKAMRDALKSSGWQLLTEGGTIVAKKGDLWFNGTTGSGEFGATIVKDGPLPHVLTLPAPTKGGEKVGDKDDFPYLDKVPGSTLKRTSVQDKTMDVSGHGEKLLVGPPVTVKEYDVPKESSAYERMLMYRDALTKAGWTIILAQSGGDSLVIAHYSKDGRDIFVYLHDGNFTVADIGAQNEAKKLLDLIAKDGHVAIYGIYFDVDKDVLKPESEVALNHILELLKLDGKLVLEVQGHTDNTGTPEHNKPLSDARAASVVKWLVAKGVADKRLKPKGYGETVPVGDNKTPEGRAKNRRVELKKL